jgi:hypothetical protein
MKKNSSSKSAEVIAFLKANSEEYSVEEFSKAKGRNSRRKRKTARERIRKAS